MLFCRIQHQQWRFPSHPFRGMGAFLSHEGELGFADSCIVVIREEIEIDAFLPQLLQAASKQGKREKQMKIMCVFRLSAVDTNSIQSFCKIHSIRTLPDVFQEFSVFCHGNSEFPVVFLSGELEHELNRIAFPEFFRGKMLNMDIIVQGDLEVEEISASRCPEIDGTVSGIIPEEFSVFRRIREHASHLRNVTETSDSGHFPVLDIVNPAERKLNRFAYFHAVLKNPDLERARLLRTEFSGSLDRNAEFSVFSFDCRRSGNGCCR